MIARMIKGSNIEEKAASAGIKVGSWITLLSFQKEKDLILT